MLAAGSNREEVVQQLLGTEGVNPNQRNQYGRTALIIAAMNKHSAVVSWLLSVGAVDVHVGSKTNWT